ncbi:MAG: hypothetical protein ACI4AK_09360 [Lepagella sp.]
MDAVDTLEARRKFVEAWNKTMIDIWQEKIFKYGIIDKGNLYHSPMSLAVRADGRFYDITLSQTFLEYGIWQDLGTGREVPIGNSGDIGRDKVRQRRPWFSPKYYASVMNLKDFYAESLGYEFIGMFADLDSDDLRRRSGYYQRKGLS